MDEKLHKCPYCDQLHTATAWHKATWGHIKNKKVPDFEKEDANNYLWICPSCHYAVSRASIKEVK